MHLRQQSKCKELREDLWPLYAEIGHRWGFIVFLLEEAALAFRGGGAAGNGCVACLYKYIKFHMSNIEQRTQ